MGIKIPDEMNKNVNRRIRLTAAVIALLSSFAFPEMIDSVQNVTAETNTIWSVALFAVFYMIQCMAVPSWLSADRRRRILSAISSALFSTAMIWGRQLDLYGQLEPGCVRAYLSFAVMTVQFSTIICLITQYINRNGVFHLKGSAVPDSIPVRNRHAVFIRDMAVMFICWLPVLLAVYPGFFVYDAQDELNEVMTRTFTGHHPLLHVLMTGGTICGVHKITGSYNAGIFCYIIIQMIVMSAIFAYVLRFIRRHSMNAGLSIIALIWFSFFPVNVMYVLCTTKDTLFSGALILSVVLLLEISEMNDDDAHRKELRIKTVLYFLSALFMTLMRHNGFYAFIVAVPFIVIFTEKNRRKILVSSVCAAAASFICTAAMTAVLCPDAVTEHQEMFTVPLQQLARTYTSEHDNLTEDERETLFEILPESSFEHYTPQLSDMLKLNFDNKAYESDPGKYIKLWAEVGAKHPMSYLNAWLMTSYGYWYPDSINNTYEGHTVFTFTYDESSYFGFETEEPGKRESMIPWLEQFYRNMSLSLYQQKVPVISMLFSPGFICWVYAFAFVLFFVSGRGRRMIPFVLLFTVWLTVLLGPGCLNRYVVYGWMGVPLILCMTGTCADPRAV